VASDVAPELSDDEISQLLASNLTADEWDRVPTDGGYVETWDLNNAAADGWAMKAGKASNQSQFLGDARGTANDYLYLNCTRLEKLYRDKAKQQVKVVYLSTPWC